MELAVTIPPSARHTGVRSVEITARILTVMAKSDGPLSLTAISELCDMAPAKTHRYLASLVESGILSHRSGGRYDIGPTAADVGLAALSRTNPVSHMGDALTALVDRTHLPTLLAVWSQQGPMVMRCELTYTSVPYGLAPGAIMPAARSATGAAFLHHLPARLTIPAVARELQCAEADVDLDAVRRPPDADGLFRVSHSSIAPTFSAARAILDLNGSPICVVATMAFAEVDIAPGSAAAAELLALR